MEIKRCANCEHAIVYYDGELICTNKNSIFRNQYVEPERTCEKHRKVETER